jgi:hypothetical protein
MWGQLQLRVPSAARQGYRQTGRHPPNLFDVDLAGLNKPSVSDARFSVDLMDRKTRYKRVASIKQIFPPGSQTTRGAH